jgi:hypothetical protein
MFTSSILSVTHGPLGFGLGLRSFYDKLSLDLDHAIGDADPEPMRPAGIVDHLAAGHVRL